MAETLIWITFGLFVGIQVVDWLYAIFKIYKAMTYRYSLTLIIYK